MRAIPIAIMLTLAGLLFWPAAARAQQPTPAFEPAPCMFEMPIFNFTPPEQMGFECGYVTVPEQHADPAGPTIELPVAIIRAGEGAAPDPLFLAQGGPGGDAFGVFSLTATELPSKINRDVVIFNQRGTLYARPSLICTEVQEKLGQILSLPGDEALPLQDAAYAACRQRLTGEGVNLSAFNSLENAADVDAIRQALGYEQINFYGVSYGTLLGLHLMRHFPDSLRSVILDSVVPTQLNYIPEVPRVTERVLDEMFAACAASPECSADYPNLEARFDALVDRLNAQPVTIPITDPDTGEEAEVFVDGTALIDMFFSAFYLPEMYAVFPALVEDMEAGRYHFWQTLWPQIVFDRTFSDGMFYSVVCAEDADFDPAQLPLEGVRPQIADTAADAMQEYIDACQMWQVTELPPSVDDPVESDIPTLLLGGQFDPITPPSYAAAAAETLPNGILVVDPIASHGVAFNGGCVDGIVQQFLDSPQIEPDTGCLAGRAPEGFVSPGTIPLQLLSDINMLEPGGLALTGLAGLFLGGVLSAFVIWPLALLVKLLRTEKQPPRGPAWLRWSSVALVLLFGGLAMLLVAGLTAFVIHALSSTPLLILSAVSGYAAPLFLIPWLLALLALAMAAAALLLWLLRGWSVWGRLYYSLLALCALGYVAMLAATGMLTALL
ncbi:MAG: hypothetical protein Kow0031_05890 [Anaerolineae bacterium]